MNFLAEIFFEIFEWLTGRSAEKYVAEGKKKQANVLLTLFLLMLIGICIYLGYELIDFLRSKR